MGLDKKRKGFDLDRKFVTYALAGSALLGTPLVTSAQTVATSGTTGNTLNFSFDNTITDFTLSAGFVSNFNSSFLEPSIYVSGPETTGFIGVETGPPGGPTIYTATAFANSGAVDPSVGIVPSGKLLKANGNTTTKGQWPNGTNDAWLGVEFQRNGNTYLGWADILASVDPSQAIPINQPAITQAVLDDDVPTQPAAQATIRESGFVLLTPEPSSIALLALGAAGIAVLRKRRGSVQ